MNKTGIEIAINQIEDIGTNFHMEVELFFVMSGKAELVIGDETYLMSKNSIIVVNSEKRHSMRKIEDGLLCRLVIDYQLISEYLDSSLFFFWCNSVAEPMGDYDKLLDLLQKLLATTLMRKGKEDFGTYGLHYQILDLLLRRYLIDQNDVRYQTDRDESGERIHEIMCYVQNNYAEELTLNELADRLYLSNAYLSRFFKKNFGQNFKDYINSVRLLHAIDDLLATDKNMTKIAMDNGFPSITRFNQVFKDEYGMSPLAYRESHIGERKTPIATSSFDEESLMQELREYVQTERILSLDDNEQIVCQQIDVANRKPMHKNWSRIINVGPLEDVMQAEAQRDILKVHEELGFSYVRFWNIFDKFICDENAQFNFNRIDRTIEFLLRNHIKPFILIGGKSRDIMRNFGNVVFTANSEDYGFLSNERAWASLMKRFCIHLLECFGAEEVSTWCFELRKPQKWDPFYNEDTDAQYLRWFEIAEKTIRHYFPYVMLGGCEFVLNWSDDGSDSIVEMLNYWSQIEFHPDFVSLAVFPYEYTRPSMNEEYLRDDIMHIRDILKKNGYEHLPVMVTEWSNTLSSRNIYNESCYKGSYIIRNMTMNADIADKIVYWSASDVLGEFADTSDLLYGGVGLVNKNGIPKPSFFAFKFMKDLYKYQICCTRNYCITTDGNGNYRILCNNMKSLSYTYCNNPDVLIGPLDYEQYFTDLEPLTLKLELVGVDKGEYEIRRRVVCKEYGSILDELIGWEYISSVKHNDVAYLEQICQPKLTLGLIPCNETHLLLDVDLPANAFELIEIKYRTNMEFNLI